ncbi:MAG: hypothetical protein H0V07_01520 [Propionibacteriales bacterium]|nr:hypothetical protein [Propionibacteriales bacterium]
MTDGRVRRRVDRREGSGTGLFRLLTRVDHDDLDWLIRHIWLRPDGLVAVEAGPVSPDLVAVERFTVFPSLRRPLIVVPALSRRATLRALLARPHLQSRANLLLRATAAAWLCGWPSQGAGARLSIAQVRNDDAGGLPQRLLPLLGQRLGTSVSALVVLGPRDPNRKPMLEVVNSRGRAVGFAKVGWNAPTRALVGNEARHLRRLERAALTPGLPRAPRVLFTHQVEGLEVVVTEPMPPSARSWPNRAAPETSVIRAVATALAGNDGIQQQPLRQLRLWDHQRAALTEVAGPAQPAADVLLRSLESALATVPHDLEVPVGGWHGDWAPWNLATVGGQLWAWDWEHATSEVPMGFDALHYVFAVLLHVDRVVVDRAVARLRERSAEVLEAFGVPASAISAVTTGYLVERWLRAHRLYADGGGWDPVIHPGLVDALRRG